jgi:O-antigen/teichoic acid export membrane protein
MAAPFHLSVNMNSLKELFNIVRSKISTGSASELSWVFTGQLLNVSLGFVIIKLLSKLGTNDYGIYALIITVSSFLALTFYGPLLQAFIRFYHHYLSRGQVKTYIKISDKILLISGIVVLLITLLSAIAAVFIDFGLSPLLLLFAGTYILSVRSGEFFNSYLNLIRKRKINSILQGSERVFLVLALLILLYSNMLNLQMVFLFFTIIVFIFTFMKIRVFRKSLPHQDVSLTDHSVFSKDVRTNITGYVIPFLIWGIAGWLQLNGEKWIIAGFMSTSDVGIYAVMISVITAFIAVPNNVLSEFATPIIFQNYADLNNKESIKTGYQYININMILVLTVTIISTLITWLYGKEIITLISRADYTVYWYLLPALCFGSGLFYTGQTLTIVGMALNKPSEYIPAKISSGVLSVILNLILISWYGIVGAAATVIIIGLYYLLYIVAVNRKILIKAEVIS